MEKLDDTYQEASLFKKALVGEATEEELLVLEKHFSEHPELKKVYEELQDSEEIKHAFEQYREYSPDKAYRKFLRQVEERQEKADHGRIRSLRIGWMAVAAVVVLAVGISFYAVHEYQRTEQDTLTASQINPGITHAILTLADGKVIDVQDKKIDLDLDGVELDYNEGLLAYRPTVTTQHNEEVHNYDSTPAASNELVIPRGGENTVLLADGTTIHLNAGSRLIYPVRFQGKRRVVTLEGEGYFDVKKDKDHPFVVHTDFGDVTVLGTTFNINAYKNAEACYATLVSGNVNFNTTDGLKQVMLNPGEQAVISAKKEITKRLVDVEEYIGWTKGVYVFNNKSLGDIMNTLEKWYNVQVYYENSSLRNLTYTGNLERYESINTFLDALQSTGDLTYKISGRNIYINSDK